MIDLTKRTTHLTFVIRNSAPIRNENCSCSYRRVTIELTPEQQDAVMMRATDTICGATFYENIELIIPE